MQRCVYVCVFHLAAGQKYTYWLHGVTSLSLYCSNTYSHPCSPIFLQYVVPLPSIPFLHPVSLISCCRLSIKGVEEVCHLTFLPTGPFIFFKQEGAKANCGFQTSSVISLCLALCLSCGPLSSAISKVSWQRCSLGIERVDLQIVTDITLAPTSNKSQRSICVC